MVTLQQVVERLERGGILRPAGPFDGRREIAQVELLGPYTVFRGDTLYLCPEGERPPERVPEGLAASLAQAGVGIRPYGDIYRWVADLPGRARVGFSPRTVNAAVYDGLGDLWSGCCWRTTSPSI